MATDKLDGALRLAEEALEQAAAVLCRVAEHSPVLDVLPTMARCDKALAALRNALPALLAATDDAGRLRERVAGLLRERIAMLEREREVCRDGNGEPIICAKCKGVVLAGEGGYVTRPDGHYHMHACYGHIVEAERDAARRDAAAARAEVDAVRAAARAALEADSACAHSNRSDAGRVRLSEALCDLYVAAGVAVRGSDDADATRKERT